MKLKLLLYYLFETLARLFAGHAAYKPQQPGIPLHFILLQHQADLTFMHNALRRNHRLRPLEQYYALHQIAQAHAEWMAANHCVEHERPMVFEPLAEEGDGVFLPPIDIVSRIFQTYGFFVEAGQNLARGPKDVATVMLGWKHSEKHLDVILNPYIRQVGFGYAQDGLGRHYWCALYVIPYMGNKMCPPDELVLDLPEPLLAADVSSC